MDIELQRKSLVDLQLREQLLIPVLFISVIIRALILKAILSFHLPPIGYFCQFIPLLTAVSRGVK